MCILTLCHHSPAQSMPIYTFLAERISSPVRLALLVYEYTMEPRSLYHLLEERRRELGLTQSEVTERAFGRDDTSAIQNIRRGKSPSITSAAAICEALGLEFYIGPKRDVGPPDPVHPMPGDVRIGDEEYSLIRRFEVNVSAGPGLIPISEDIDGRLAFSRSWLIRHGISADLSGLVKVRGDSMAPTIPDGALVLIHCPEMFLEREGIYAFSRSGEAFIKRLVPVDRRPDGQVTSLVIISDSGNFPPEVVTGPDLNEIRIVGRIRCILIDL